MLDFNKKLDIEQQQFLWQFPGAYKLGMKKWPRLRYIAVMFIVSLNSAPGIHQPLRSSKGLQSVMQPAELHGWAVDEWNSHGAGGMSG